MQKTNKDVNERLNSLRAEIETARKEHKKNIKRVEEYQEEYIPEAEFYDDEQLESPMEYAERKMNESYQLLAYKERLFNLIKIAVDYEKKYQSDFRRIIKKQTCKEVKDQLDRTNQAKDIAELINDSDVKSIGVFGEWGTGKSTFLEYIKKFIPKDNNKIIDIKATEYSDQESVWTYLFLKMKESVKKEILLNILYTLKKLCKSIKFSQVITGLILLAFVAVVLLKWDLLIVICEYFGIDINLAMKISTGTNWLVFIVLVVKLLWPVIRELKTTVELSIDTLVLSEKRDVKEKLGYKAVIKENIEIIVNTWKKYTFFIFVDELDRCNNTAIMSFLESIQLVEEYSSIKILYAIDSDIILHAIEESGIHNPHNYLKKYVDVKVDLESVNRQVKCIKSIASDDYKFEVDEVDLIQTAISDLDINISIRDYLHILNFLSEFKERWLKEEVFSKKYLEEEGLELLDWLNVIPLAVFYFAGSFWPRMLYDDFREYKDIYTEIKYCLITDDYINKYKKCPMLLKNMKIIDVKTAFYYLYSISPVVGINSR